ncbi:MAG: DUF58 domain-containing protein [Candidatus Bipolaricaulis sp.]|nr:DUF58 domain-containing protein [Candidatus Bipolaricaulis sp.]
MSDPRYPIAACLSVGIVVAALVLRRAGLFMAAIPILAYAGALLTIRLRLRRPELDITRTPSTHRVCSGDDVQVQLTITNCGIPWPLIGVLDKTPDDEPPCDGSAAYLGPIARNEDVRLSYTLRPRRGLHLQDQVTVVSWAWSGLVFQEHDFVCSTYVSAIPEIEKLPPLSLTPRRTHAFAGSIMARAAGPGVDFFGCRGYVPGDDIRRINWRALARTDRLVVNEYEQERMADVIIVLDVRAQAHVEVGARGTFEAACRAAASLANHLIRSGNRVGFLLYGQTVDWIQPAGGRFHLERILASIIRAKPVRSFAFEDLANIPMSIFPSGSQLILLSSLPRDDDYRVPIQLAARGYSVLVLHVHSEKLQASAEPADDALELALRIRELRRSAVVRQMRSKGVRVLAWDTEEPLAAALHRARHERDGGRRHE